MPKEINIREIKKSQAKSTSQTVRAMGGFATSTPKEPSGIPPQAPPVTQSFISRFLDIMVCDIMQKLRRPLPVRLENLTKKAEDFEKFEQFCDLARGKR